MTRKRILIFVPILVVLVVATVWGFGYHASEFKGGIQMRDSGFFSFPRYHAQIGELPLWKDGEYQFAISGLPSDRLDLSVLVVDATYGYTDQLSSLSTDLTVSVADRSGQILCTATGKLSDAKHRGLNSWVLASSDVSASFWHPLCKSLPISRSKAYVVKVFVSDSDSRSPHKMLMPVLQGGGNELP